MSSVLELREPGTHLAAGFGAAFIEVPDLSFTRLVGSHCEARTREGSAIAEQKASTRNWTENCPVVDIQRRVQGSHMADEALGVVEMEDGGQLDRAFQGPAGIANGCPRALLWLRVISGGSIVPSSQQVVPAGRVPQ
jgi:hypothetical protein